MNNEFATLDRLEQADEVDVQAWLREFHRIYAQRSPQQRAYACIKAYFGLEDPSEEAYQIFIDWLYDDDADAKHQALEQVFNEMCEHSDLSAEHHRHPCDFD